MRISDDLGLDLFPDTLTHEGEEYQVYYHAKQGERDDGVTLGVHVDQLPKLPVMAAGLGRGWKPARTRRNPAAFAAEGLPPRLPADRLGGRWFRGTVVSCAEGHADLFQALSEHVKERTGARVPDGCL